MSCIPPVIDENQMGAIQLCTERNDEALHSSSKHIDRSKKGVDFSEIGW